MEKLIVPFGFSCNNILLSGNFQHLFEVCKPEQLLYKHFKLLVTPSAARDKALAVAHDEDISAWKRAIALWMQQSDSNPISLMQLHQALELPLIEVWLGLLLGEQEQYQWETGGEFYSEAGEIWLRLELLKRRHHASSRSQIGK